MCRDIADAIGKLLISDIQGERFILSAGSASYQELFAAIAKGFGKRPPHLKVGVGLAGVIWRVEAVRSWLTGSQAADYKGYRPVGHASF